MHDPQVSFTPADRAVLESYKTLVEGLAGYLGDGYEIVLHSLENLEHSAVKVANGHHTGRREGAPITDLALSMLSRLTEKNSPGYVCYNAKNKFHPAQPGDRGPAARPGHLQYEGRGAPGGRAAGHFGQHGLPSSAPQ